jgi:hypothetical protein
MLALEEARPISIFLTAYDSPVIMGALNHFRKLQKILIFFVSYMMRRSALGESQ